MSEVEKRDLPKVISLKHCFERDPKPEMCTDIFRNNLAVALGVSINHLLFPKDKERVCDSTRGLGLYSQCNLWGFRLPLSNFAAEILRTVNVAPSQLNASAWCYINSFEALFYIYQDKFSDCPLKEPTLALFLHYYHFQVEKCWVKCVRRKWVLFDTISNPGKWQNGFFFLAPGSVDITLPGSPPVRTKWNGNSVNLPGRRVLNQNELQALRIIEEIKEGNHNAYLLCLHLVI